MLAEEIKSVISKDKGVKIPVMEIFDSIQGEGSMIGMPVTFIRISGCNLACPWCDTKESWMKPCAHPEIDYCSTEEMRSRDMHCLSCGAEGTREQLQNLEVVATKANYKWMTIEEIAAECSQKAVVITGGEPCTQDLFDLIELLHEKELFVCMETNGTLATPANIDWVTASPKPPEFMIHAECFFNELKYVVDDNFALDCIPEESKQSCGGTWLQPCDYGKGNAAKTADSTKRAYDLVMSTTYLRLGVQLHKIMDFK